MAHHGLRQTFPQRFLNPFLAQAPQGLSRPSQGGRISGSGAAAPAGGRRIGTAGPFRFLFGHEKEKLPRKLQLAKKPAAKKGSFEGTFPHTSSLSARRFSAAVDSWEI